jgi:hypothetical protein
VRLALFVIGIQPLDRSGQRPELSQATGMVLVRCILGKLSGVVCHCFPPAFRRSHFRHQVPPLPPRRKRSQRRKVELWARIVCGNFPEMTTSAPFRDLLHGTEGRRAEDFFALKNQTASAGFEPANLGTKAAYP